MQHLQPGTTLQGGKYRIEKLLGQGGFGITYLAEQSLLKIKVAIKEFFIRDLCARDDSASVYSVTQSDMVDRYRLKFIKEAQIIARFNHPGIVRVTDIFEENGTVYYVMDYVEGENLDEIIKREGALPEERALGYITKVAEALDYIHQHNVNHLDIKPSNIMIRKNDDQPILIDFGVSKQYDEHMDQTTTTPPGVSYGYSPFEQYKPGGVSTFSPQADIYALGATLYKLITGKTPPTASDLINYGIPPITNVSHNVRMAIEKAMQIRIENRPNNISEFVGLFVDAIHPEVNNPIADGPNETPDKNGEVTLVGKDGEDNTSDDGINALDDKSSTSDDNNSTSDGDSCTSDDNSSTSDDDSSTSDDNNSTSDGDSSTSDDNNSTSDGDSSTSDDDSSTSDGDNSTSDSIGKKNHIVIIIICGLLFLIFSIFFFVPKLVNSIDEASITKDKSNQEEWVSDSSNIDISNHEESLIDSALEILYPDDAFDSVDEFESSHVFDVVDLRPTFPGGQEALLTWLSSNIHYPPIAEEKGIQGKVVVSFVIEPDGSISNVTVVHGVDQSLDEEAVRVVKSMPKWNPGKQNGQAVRVKYNLPITFKL